MKADQDFVVPLRDATEVGNYGGKAANLAKMLQANLQVPPGFAVGLGAFITKGKLSIQAKQQITNLLSKQQLYAVRSSALAEDANGASWAGQFETFLNTESEDVIAKVEACHNSAKARAQAYADSRAEARDFNIAVVVQEMIQPDYAGVLFTKDPVRGRNVVVAEYVKGLGEQLVNGTVTPEGFEWDRQLNKIVEKTVDIPFDAQTLANLTLAVESLYGAPQDIEWAVAKGTFYLVQARPITTLPGKQVNYKDG